MPQRLGQNEVHVLDGMLGFTGIDVEYLQNTNQMNYVTLHSHVLCDRSERKHIKYERFE